MLSITTDTGYRLDVDPKATIEVNMGGISLLNLADRTATYTNSFKLPRTPNNESIFSFASQPTRNNRPVINVLISKGLFQRSAVLKVLDTNSSDYNCSVSYKNQLSLISDKNYEYLLQNITLYTGTQETDFIASICNGDMDIYYIQTDDSRIPNTPNAPNSLSIPTSSLLSKIEVSTGCIFIGDLLSDTDFMNSYITIPTLYVTRTGTTTKTWKTNVVDSGLLITDLLSQIALLFFADIKFNENSIELKKVNTTATPIVLDGFNFDKKMVSGIEKTNYISYSVSKSITNKYQYSDIVIGTGDKTKELINLKVYLPAGDGTLYTFSSDADIFKKIIIGTSVFFSTDTTIKYQSSFLDLIFGTDSLYVFQMFNLSGFYSSILNPIFANPVILEATRYIDPLTADNIMNTRVINSVQLGGRYWVDSMAYNLTTGQSKMTLIKLP